MFKRIFITLLLGLSFGMGLTSAQAQGQLTPIWLAEYWNNQYLNGSPELVREENFIDYNWGTGSPADDIDDDHFSARWTADVRFEAGTYSFNATSDDGVQVWIDGDLIIDEWYDHSMQTFSATKRISDGLHHIVVEYYENDSGAIMQLWWAPAPPTSTQNWTGEYFNNVSLRGSPVMRAVSFNWGQSSPNAAKVGTDRFSARWTKTLKPATNQNGDNHFVATRWRSLTGRWIVSGGQWKFC